MNKKNIILISKEVLRKDLLGIYGGRKNTPAINELAKNGTRFNQYYTGGGSTAMAFTAMFTGLNPYEVKGRRAYEEVSMFTQSQTLFQKCTQYGFESHVVWPRHFDFYVNKYLKIFDDHVHMHALMSTATHIPSTRDWTYFKKLDQYDPSKDGFGIYRDALDTIVSQGSSPVFVWVHLPHALIPYRSYEEDIEIFDQFVGSISKAYDADLFITGDHGHMRGEKGQYAYGFSVYEPVVNVPLITPRLPAGPVIDYPVSATQLINIILDRQVEQKEFVYADTQYYEQINRILMIRSDNYKYIFNKRDSSEELYDLSFDPGEQVNLLQRYYRCPYRHVDYPLEEVLYYNAWETARAYYYRLRTEKERIWEKGRIRICVQERCLDALRNTWWFLV
ncbi:MAG: sulfatase-like hydrolase/transferase, partial [Elusimicrobia bacterium]|nr:sulfatase-like hydrolase/transferase [Elusimicrobiota bacterium]